MSNENINYNMKLRYEKKIIKPLHCSPICFGCFCVAKYIDEQTPEIVSKIFKVKSKK